MKYLAILLALFALTVEADRRSKSDQIQAQLQVQAQNTRVKIEGDHQAVENQIDIDGDEQNVSVRGGDVGISHSVDYPRQVPNTAVAHTPNYIECMMGIGVQTATTRGSAFIGIPIKRNRACDLWLAVNEAQENGHILLSYGFMCQIPAVRGLWGKERCSRLTEQAIEWTELALKPPTEQELAKNAEIGELTAQRVVMAAQEQRQIVVQLQETDKVIQTQAATIDLLRGEITQEKTRRRAAANRRLVAEQTLQDDLATFLEELEARGE